MRADGDVLFAKADQMFDVAAPVIELGSGRKHTVRMKPLFAQRDQNRFGRNESVTVRTRTVSLAGKNSRNLSAQLVELDRSAIAAPQLDATPAKPGVLGGMLYGVDLHCAFLLYGGRNGLHVQCVAMPIEKVQINQLQLQINFRSMSKLDQREQNYALIGFPKATLSHGLEG